MPLIVELVVRHKNVHCIILIDVIHTLMFSENSFKNWSVTFTILVNAGGSRNMRITANENSITESVKSKEIPHKNWESPDHGFAKYFVRIRNSSFPVGGMHIHYEAISQFVQFSNGYDINMPRMCCFTHVIRSVFHMRGLTWCNSSTLCRQYLAVVECDILS